MNIKYWIIFIIAIFILGLLGTVSIQNARIKKLNESLSISKANEKALLLDKDSLNSKTRILQLTIEELNYLNDSISNKIKQVIKESNIKDKDIKELQYQLSIASKKDTIIFKDTIFKESLIKDTTLRNDWYSINLRLEYPNTIITNPMFISEKYAIINYKKETINPPKKCFISRWFQKKHKVIRVEVIEKNPYIKTKEQRFIKIVD